MRSNASATMLVVRKEEKEATLKEFIEKDLMARKAAGASAGDGCYRLIALSQKSPVAKALAALAPEAAALGIEIRAVFMTLDSPTPEGEGGRSVPMAASACRLISDPRIIDAHEQLVLGDRTAWVGDCMRRDPATRDAFECYSEDCALTATWATRSFDRIWACAEPAGCEAKRVGATPEILGLGMLMTATPDAPPVVAVTRH
jgi:hypothetical protein